MPNYTTEELIQYVYHETRPEKTKAIEKALEYDWDLRKNLMLERILCNN